MTPWHTMRCRCPCDLDEDEIILAHSGAAPITQRHDVDVIVVAMNADGKIG
jgi:hypothetical protein